MAITNWITETSIDPVTGGVLTTITVAGPLSERYVWQWLSAAAPAPGPASGGAAASNPLVAFEAAIAGPQLLAAVAAKTAAPITVRIPKPHK